MWTYSGQPYYRVPYAAGREVRDGGGVTPDIAVKQEKLPNILFYLVNDNLIFNYATDYCLKHPTILQQRSLKLQMPIMRTSRRW